MIVSNCGSPAEGTIVTESLVVPEPGAAMIMRANPVLHPMDPGIHRVRAWPDAWPPPCDPEQICSWRIWGYLELSCYAAKTWQIAPQVSNYERRPFLFGELLEPRASVITVR